ncbi:hypothetical protein A2U01_0004953, partial [Trifolium medium]|nr:hypothetical protein [Trifolium medium]
YDDPCFPCFPSCMKYTMMGGSYKILDQSLRNTRTKVELIFTKTPPTAVCLLEDPLSVPTSPSTRPHSFQTPRRPSLLRYAPTLFCRVERRNSDVSELFNKLNTFDIKLT